MKLIQYWFNNRRFSANPYAENFRAYFVMHEGKQVRLAKYLVTEISTP